MAATLLEKFARTLVVYSLDTRPGDMFVIRTSVSALPLLKEVYREAVRVGANVHYRMAFDEQDEIYYSEAAEAQLDWVSPLDRLEMESADCRLTIQAPSNTRASSGIDPRRYARHMRALSGLNSIYRNRSADGSLRWCGTLFPTNALAQEAGMSLREYEQFVFSAMFLDRDDPIAAWTAFSTEQQKRADLMATAKELRFVAPDTDLTLRVEGRKWMNSDGHRNFPSGEVFTGPIEDSANGYVRFTYPAIAGGRAVEDVRLWFEKGRVAKASAARGTDYLQEMLDTDAGARFLGEVAVGNNYNIQQFTGNTLFDEKIGGTFHLAVGASYPETGGRNDSSLHWDMVCDMRQGGAIYADGQLIHENGQWKA